MIKLSTVTQAVSIFQAALAWKLDNTLERVPSLCQTRQGNSLWRGMGGTLALWGLSTPLKGMGVNCPLSGPPGLRSSLGGEAVSTRGNSLAVLCVYTLQLNWFPAVRLYSVVHWINLPEAFSFQPSAFSFWTSDFCLQPRSFSLLDHSRSFQIEFQKSRRSRSRSSSSNITQDQILTCYASKNQIL